MEGLATALGNFVEEAQGLSAQFDPQVVFYIGPWGVTQYIAVHRSGRDVRRRARCR